MSKIKGIELKNITNFRGHEGEDLIQGNVYYKNKKVGYYSQDAHGGMDIFDLNYNLDKDLRNEIRNITDNYIGGKLFRKLDELYYGANFNYEQKGFEYLFMDLMQLNEHEKIYKKYSKKWNTNKIFIIYNDAWHMNISGNKLREQDLDKVHYEYNDLKDFVVE